MRLVILCFSAALAWADPAQILTKRCVSCHNSSSKMGNLSLATRADAERVLSGRLLERIEKGQMPPGGGLPAAELSELKAWLAAGAPWQGTLSGSRKWWSLQPIEAKGTSIDQYIEAALTAKGLELSAPEPWR